jgi:ABC-type methionine transport system ATPase subunit
MIKKRVLLNFPQELLKEPIIYSVGQQFQLATNIHRADVVEDRGCFELDLTGEEQQIDEAVAWMMGRGVRVEVLLTEG